MRVPRILDNFYSSPDPWVVLDLLACQGYESSQWFFDSPFYTEWRSADTRPILLVTAGVGAGKTVAMRTLVDVLKSDSSRPSVIHYFCLRDSNRTVSPAAMLCNLIHQILSRDWSLHDLATKLYSPQADRTNAEQEPYLTDLLFRLADASTRPIIAILDSVDVIRDRDGVELTTNLLHQLTRKSTSYPRLKMIITSRPADFGPVTRSDNISYFQAENLNLQPDIRKTIANGVADLARKKDLAPEVRDLLIEKIVAHNKHAQTFLGVKFAFESFGAVESISSQTTASDIDGILLQVADKFGDHVEAVLEHSSNPEHARRLFGVLIAVRRTLKIDEFRVVYAVTESDADTLSQPKTYDEIDLSSSRNEFAGLVKECCGSLIVFSGDSVHFFHQAIKDYLLTSAQPNRPNVTLFNQQSHPADSSWKDSISCLSAEKLVAKLCLDIITFSIPLTWIKKMFDHLNTGHMNGELRKYTSTRPLFEYAAFNWYEHVTSGGEEARHLLRQPRYAPILDISKTSFWVWFLPTVARLVYWSSGPVEIMAKVWDRAKNSLHHIGYGAFLRDHCLSDLFPAHDKVKTIIKASIVDSTVSQDILADDALCWRADEGYHLCDLFHSARGEHTYISSYIAVRELECGHADMDSELVRAVPLNVLIWVSLVREAPKALRIALAQTGNDTSWLLPVQDHAAYLEYARFDSNTISQAKRQQYEKTWWWHPAFPAFQRMNTSSYAEDIAAVFANWIRTYEISARDVQRLWSVGAFIVPASCKRLIAAGVSIDAEIWRDSRTALQIAAIFWEHEIVSLLCDSGADIRKRCPRGYTALHYLLLSDRIFSNDVVKRRIFPYMMDGDSRRPHLKKSGISSSITALIGVAHDQASMVNEIDRLGRTPLMLAVASSTTATRILLRHGADVNRRDHKGRTALIHYLRDNYEARPIHILQELLQAGADPQITDLHGDSVLSRLALLTTSKPFSSYYPGSNFINKTFHALLQIGSFTDRVLLLTQIRKVHIPLAVAARLGNAELCWALLDAGVDPNEHGIDETSALSLNDGSEASNLDAILWNPLMVALWSKAYTVAAILLHHGASAEFQVPPRTRLRSNKFEWLRSGLTPLHVSIAGDKMFPTFGIQVGLPTNWKTKGCLYQAVGDPDCEIIKECGLSRLAEMQHRMNAEMQAQRAAAKDSDSEYEYRRTVWSNDNTEAEGLPFDKLFGARLESRKPPEASLHQIIEECDSISTRQAAMIEFLIQTSGHVNSMTVEGITPLLLAINTNNTAAVVSLLTAGANPDAATKSGVFPLLLAANLGQTGAVRHLLKSGANPNAQLWVPGPDKCACCTFVQWGTYRHTTCAIPLTALAIAAHQGHVEMIEALLDAGAHPNLSIIHHAHGCLPGPQPQKRSGRFTKEYASDSEDEGGITHEHIGMIGVATALTWARDESRSLLLRRGADPSIEQPLRRCDCVVVAEQPPPRQPHPRDDSDYPESEEDSSNTPLPWRRHRKGPYGDGRQSGARKIDQSDEDF